MAWIRIIYRHVVLPGDDYHEWITLDKRIRADINGRANHRMHSANWVEWICNNSDCPALAWVHEDFVRSTLNDLAPLP